MEPSIELFGEYIAEREGGRLLTAPHGFLAYRLDEDAIHIGAFFVRAPERGSGRGTELFERLLEVARKNGIRRIRGTCLQGADVLKIARHRNFTFTNMSDGTVLVEREF